MNAFFITGYPRSKTAWIANFLTYGNTICLHDSLHRCRTVGHDLKQIMEATGFENVGHSDPMNLMFKDQIAADFPNAPWVVVERDVKDVVNSSVNAFGSSPELSELFMLRMAKGMAIVKSEFRTLTVAFEDVENRIEEIAEHCVKGFKCPPERASMLSHFNIQLQGDYLLEKAELNANHPILARMES